MKSSSLVRRRRASVRTIGSALGSYRRPIENFGSDDRLFQTGAIVGQGALDNISKEARGAVGAGEFPAREQAFQLLQNFLLGTLP